MNANSQCNALRIGIIDTIKATKDRFKEIHDYFKASRWKLVKILCRHFVKVKMSSRRNVLFPFNSFVSERIIAAEHWQFRDTYSKVRKL